jgi:hypothetical protein
VIISPFLLPYILAHPHITSFPSDGSDSAVLRQERLSQA